jgi:hypothetical protein
VAELGDVDDVADRRERADHLAAGRAAPAQAAVLGVERVDVAVEGADEDGRRAVLGVGDDRARVGVAAGRVGPGEGAVGGVVGVDAAVVVAGVDPPVGHRGGRVELAGAAEAGAERAALPDQPAALGVDRVHVAAVVADVEAAAVVGRRRLDRAAERGRPAHLALAGAERVEVAVFAAEVDGAADHDRRGLGPPRQRAFPDHPAGPRVQLDDVAGDEVDDVEAVAGVGRRGGVEATDPPFPEDVAVPGVEGEGEPRVVDRVEAAAGEDRRELEQRSVRVAPDFLVGRAHPPHRQVLGAGAVEAEDRPVDPAPPGHLLRRRRLVRFEAFDRLLVVDVGGALQQLVADDPGAEDRAERQQHDRDHAVGALVEGVVEVRPPRHQKVL